VPGVHEPQFSDGRVTFDVDSDHLDAAIRHLSRLGIRSLVSHPPTLEELFLRQYGDEVKQEVSR
jgi:ABC-2 type transport system ATP-binding protein